MRRCSRRHEGAKVGPIDLAVSPTVPATHGISAPMDARVRPGARSAQRCGCVAEQDGARGLPNQWIPREPTTAASRRGPVRGKASTGGTAHLVGDGCDGGLDDRIVPLLGAAGDKALQLRDLEREGRVLGLCTVAANRCVCACVRARALGVRSHARTRPRRWAFGLAGQRARLPGGRAPLEGGGAQPCGSASRGTAAQGLCDAKKALQS
jgi:hypothetical protein